MFTKKPMNLNHEITLKVDDESVKKVRKVARDVSITVIETAIVLGALKFVQTAIEHSFEDKKSKKQK